MTRLNGRGHMLVALLVVLLSASVACGKPQRVGSEGLTAFEEQDPGGRLGERSPSPDSTQSGDKVGLGGPSPSPSPSPTQAESFFEVTLIAESPYFHPGNALTVPVGVTLRVTNKDTTEERPTRSFSAKDGSFDSGSLRPGQVWTYKMTVAGFWDIVDDRAPFIFATLEAR